MPRIRPEGGLTGKNASPSTDVATGMWTMRDVDRNIRNNTWPIDVGQSDQFFNLSTILIHADGTDNANNNTIVDSGPNALTITRTGTPSQGTFSPYSQTGWSYFGGASDYATVNYSSALDMAADFTVEAWIYRNTNSQTFEIICGRWQATSTNIFQFYLSSTGTVLSFALSNNSTVINAPYSFAYNTWYHVAAVRSGTTINLYVDGTIVGSANGITYNFTHASQPLAIGRNAGAQGTQNFNGYISNLRIVQSAVYTESSFTPPNTPLTAIINTSLLTCSENRFIDKSINGLTVIPSGSSAIVPISPFSPSINYSTSLVGGSLYFNGSTDYITLPNNMTPVSNSAYTLEGWFYPTTVAAAEIPVVKLYNSTQTIEFRIVSSKIQGRINNSATIVGGNSTIYPNQWYHFALVKPTAGSNTAVLYINGVAESTTATDTTTYTAFTTPRIGANQTPNLYYTGYVSGVRFLNGTGLYTGNFTPPSAPISSISNTLFLINANNAGIIDQTSKNNMSTLGASRISTSVSKFGSGSIYLDGSQSSYIITPASPLFVHNGDYTVELWFYPLAAQNSTLLDQYFASTTGAGNWQLYMSSGRLLQFYYNGGSFIQHQSLVTLNTWNHIAATRSGSTIRLFLNGVVGTTTATSSAVLGRNDTLWIGAQHLNGPLYYPNGYMDEIRISRYAAYTSTFTPVGTPFKDR